MIPPFPTWVSFRPLCIFCCYICSFKTHISEVFIEAVIQLHLLFLLIGWLASVDVPPRNWVTYDEINLLGDNKLFIWLSFSISVSSATFGLAKFLKSGPFKILNEGPHVVGIGITLLIISSFMISKAVWVVLGAVDIDDFEDEDGKKHSMFVNFFNGPLIFGWGLGLGQLSLLATWYLFWFIFSMVPQILMVSFLLKLKSIKMRFNLFRH